jgi:hypothetical protein
MESEVLAIAIIKPFDGHDQDVVTLLNSFYAMLTSKGYCRDVLYRGLKDPSRLVNLRYWKSDEMRREASEDPDVHRYWHQLITMAEVERVYEQLHEVPLRSATSGE